MTTGLLELGEVMLSASERRLETVSRNVSNASTPGFKKEVTFENIISGAENQQFSAPPDVAYTDFSQGGLRLTGRPLDLAISGAGFFALRSENQIFYTRGGEFSRAEDGRVVSAQGFFLQSASGDDLLLSSGRTEILDDGVVVEDGLPIARIGLFTPPADQALEAIGGSLFKASDAEMQDVGAPLIRQGMIEGANVELASEMVTMMAALRQAEAGARIVQVYDSLMGQSISTFGRASR